MSTIILTSYMKVMKRLNVKPTIEGLIGYKKLVEEGTIKINGVEIL